MKNRLTKYQLLCMVIFVCMRASSQSISLDMPQYEDMMRREQLQGKINPSISFNIRPIPITTDKKADSSVYQYSVENRLFKSIVSTKWMKVSLLPLSTTQQYITHHPFMQNDGAMIPAVGYQHLISTGVYASLGPISIQLKPQWVYAQNKNFQGFPKEHDDQAWATMYGFWNGIDLPEKFGNKAYQKYLPGNSSVRINFAGLSAGLSTENIWWGPAFQNALILSNHAQGFLHATINTQRPIQTTIGSFEAQMIMGNLTASGFSPPSKYSTNPWWIKQSTGDRYINAIIFSYSPKYVKGLSLGVTRAITMYEQVRKELGQHIVVFNNVARKNDSQNYDDIVRDQLASLFFRYFSVKHKFEVYTEWGRNDAFFNLRDFIQTADHSQAYTIGFRKLMNIEKKDYQLLIESTHLQRNAEFFIRATPSWYQHRKAGGYTNNGEVLGAGIGPGSNMQLIRFSKYNGINQLAIQVERTAQNMDFYQEAFSGDQAATRKWVDYGISFIADQAYKQFLFSAKITALRSLNYQWYQPPSSSSVAINNNWDVNNFLVQLGITYRW